MLVVPASLQPGPRYAESDYERWEDPKYTRGIDDYCSRYASLGAGSEFCQPAELDAIFPHAAQHIHDWF